jgi:hyperosmotically inducible protein
MTVQRWIAPCALGLTLALPSPGLGQTAAKDKGGQKVATKSKGTAHKAGDKTSKAGGKTKGTGIETDDAVVDSWITLKIKTDLDNESALKGNDVTVDTKDKVVTLTGTVASAEGRARAEQIAKQTQGVARVVDNLTIRPK